MISMAYDHKRVYLEVTVRKIGRPVLLGDDIALPDRPPFLFYLCLIDEGASK